MEMRMGRVSKWLHPETEQAERVELFEPKESKGKTERLLNSSKHGSQLPLQLGSCWLWIPEWELRARAMTSAMSS